MFTHQLRDPSLPCNEANDRDRHVLSLPASTSLTSFGASRFTKAVSPDRDASHRISSSRNRMTPSYPSDCAWLLMTEQPIIQAHEACGLTRRREEASDQGIDQSATALRCSAYTRSSVKTGSIPIAFHRTPVSAWRHYSMLQKRRHPPFGCEGYGHSQPDASEGNSPAAGRSGWSLVNQVVVATQQALLPQLSAPIM